MRAKFFYLDGCMVDTEVELVHKEGDTWMFPPAMEAPPSEVMMVFEADTLTELWSMALRKEITWEEAFGILPVRFKLRLGDVSNRTKPVAIYQEVPRAEI